MSVLPTCKNLSVTRPEEIPELPLSAEALAFLRDVMLGNIKETKVTWIKSVKKCKDGNEDQSTESYKLKTAEVAPELETRMKAAERILKYTSAQDGSSEAEGETGVLILADIKEVEDYESDL